MLCFICRTEEACFRGETEERASELEGSEKVQERIQLNKEGGKTVVARVDGKGSKYISHLRLVERMKEKGVKRDAWRQNGEEIRHLSGVSRIDKTVT